MAYLAPAGAGTGVGAWSRDGGRGGRFRGGAAPFAAGGAGGVAGARCWPEFFQVIGDRFQGGPEPEIGPPSVFSQ